MRPRQKSPTGSPIDKPSVTADEDFVSALKLCKGIVVGISEAKVLVIRCVIVVGALDELRVELAGSELRNEGYRVVVIIAVI